MMSSLVLFLHQLRRETRLIWRQFKLILNATLFFLMVMFFSPLAMPADTALLKLMVPGLVWIALLLACLLSAERLFQSEYDDGVIEQWLLSGYSFPLFISAKIVVHWVFVLLPMIIITPLLALLFHLTFYETVSLILSLFFGTPALLFLCALAAVFCIGVKQKGVLMALILMPLTIPIMIFGSGTLLAAMNNLAIDGFLALLLAMSILASSLLPFAIAALLKMSLNE